MNAIVSVTRLTTCVVLALSMIGCAGGGAGPSFSAQPNDQQPVGIGMPQSVGAQALQEEHADGPPPLPNVPLDIGRTVLPDLTKPVLTDSGSYVGGPIILGTNTGSTGTGVEGVGGLNGYGVVGVASSVSGGGAGVYGKATALSATGVYGYSSKHDGVVGSSGQGYGVYGTTTNSAATGGFFVNSASNGTALKATATGGVGVAGNSTSGSGLSGLSSSGFGVYGQSVTAASLVGNSQGAGAGAFASGDSGYGLDANTFGASAVIHAQQGGSGPVLVATGSTGDAIDASTGGGIGIDVTNSNGNGSDITGSYIGLLGRAPAGTGTFPLDLTDKTGVQQLFYVDGNGDVFYHGTLSSFAVHGPGGRATITYASQATSPMVEAVGSGQLSRGVETVSLDPAFASSIDPQKPYHVMLTPDGDTRGLFVASKSRASFVVREVQGGRSSIGFDYHVYGTSLARANPMGNAAMPNAKFVSLPASRPEHMEKLRKGM